MIDHLPENIDDWPRDPFELLAVDSSVSERDLKRAYTKLIRAYKPEHAPEQFRLIREAYESAREQLKWNAFTAEHNVHVDHETGTLHIKESDKAPEVKKQSARPPTRGVDAELRSVWKNVRRDHFDETYYQLRKLGHQYPHNEEITSACYWLKLLDSNVDSERSEAEILLSGIERNGLNSPLSSTLIRTLKSSSREDIDYCFEKLSPNLGSGQLDSLLRLRWRAAADADDWEVIRRDLDQLEVQFIDDISGWLTLQINALEQAKFSHVPAADKLIRRCQSEFERQTELQLQYNYLFDQAGSLVEVAEESKRIANSGINSMGGSSPISITAYLQLVDNLKLVKEVEHLDAAATRQKLMPLLDEWVQDPLKWLQQLTSLSANAHHNQLLTVLAQISYEICDEKLLTGQELADVLSFELTHGDRISDLSNTANYKKLQKELLTFCLAEYADIDEVAYILTQMIPYIPSDDDSWKSRLAIDFPLRLIIRGTFVYWG